MTRSRVLIPVLAIVVLVVGGVAYAVIRANQQQQELIDGIAADARSALAASPVDLDELSRVRVRMQKVPGHETLPAFRRIRAAIDLQRGNPQAAWDELAPLALGPTGGPADIALAAVIARDLSERVTGSSYREMAGMAMDLGARWAADADGEEASRALWVAIQGALRSEDPERARELGSRLVALGGKPAELWQALEPVLCDGEPGNAESIGSAMGALGEAPVEALAGHALSLVRRQGSETAGSRDDEEIQDLLRVAINRAPTVVLVRDACFQAALLRGAVARSQGEEKVAERAAAEVLRHCSWLVENGNPGDPRMEMWVRFKDGAKTQIR